MWMAFWCGFLAVFCFFCCWFGTLFRILLDCAFFTQGTCCWSGKKLCGAKQKHAGAAAEANFANLVRSPFAWKKCLKDNLECSAILKVFQTIFLELFQAQWTDVVEKKQNPVHPFFMSRLVVHELCGSRSDRAVHDITMAIIRQGKHLICICMSCHMFSLQTIAVAKNKTMLCKYCPPTHRGFNWWPNPSHWNTKSRASFCKRIFCKSCARTTD